MPASLDRSAMMVKPTARDKGLQLTLNVVAYDNGIIQVDGIPIDAGEGWLGATEVIMTTLNEFHRQIRARRNTAQVPPTETPAQSGMPS
ncbi:hypothetical protein GCM10010123_09550 [Pilimelia anulata]|uniref:Uncharacterized protein n=1 Tax=Pilimelia anulata TaxID=53371 RepID=A0A8J3B3Z2_9ACTN|nr:hypothetical protein [Pilimelia anulata]GGJ81852.1 hypothetical protein GCM10010123_09550 [Pilimelia anulata]